MTPTLRSFESHSAAETMEIGRRLAEELKAGDVLALHGELGSGKTCLVKGIALGLGVTQDVTSPTYTLIHEYQGGRLSLCHADLYRLDSPGQALAIGIEDCLQPDGVTVIEWAEKIEALLPATTRHVRLTATSESSRRIEIS
jgi:tRNA threonylcarbamoyladenosine biosynthesis protein TsaE